MEDYIAGVVAAEMDPSFPKEALAAQAIIARTFTLRRLALGEIATDDVTRFQAYEPARITEKIREAVAETRGMVIVYQNDLADTVYHACAGGRTAGADEGMRAPERPYLRPVADPPCRRDETWTASFSPPEVAAAAGVKGPLREVTFGRRGESGRLLTLQVNGREVSAFALRARLGGTRMKSTYLTTVQVAKGQVTFNGRGYGHGVGLSQWGAAALAEQGFTAEEIIRHYYTDVLIERRW